MRRLRSLGLLVLLGLAVGTSVGACSGSQTEPPSGPSATATASPELQAFTSDVYGYTIGYPVGWSANAATRQLRDAEMPILGLTAADKFTRDPAKGLDPLLFIGAQLVPDGITLERWARSV